ncbi:MAG TPA: Amuc_1100 family pilus-like protein, partial [Verrucomicrobiae bacterium]
MSWIKRNLFFVVGGIVALGLLGAGGFYIYTDWTRNSDATVKLDEYYDTLKKLQSQTPAPGNNKINNTEIAKAQQQQVQAWVESAGKYFQFIAAIPLGAVTSETFKSALDRTVDQLQREAAGFGVTLPPKYDFSFSAMRLRMIFSTGSLEPLAVQLGEVKAIAESVFATRVNSLDSIQRVRVSDDDATGPQGDYI